MDLLKKAEKLPERGKGVLVGNLECFFAWDNAYFIISFLLFCRNIKLVIVTEFIFDMILKCLERRKKEEFTKRTKS